MAPSTISWVPAEDKDAWIDGPVSYLYTCACTPSLVASDDLFAPPSSLQTNHWLLYLRVDEAELISIDPSAGLNGKLDLRFTPSDETDMNKLAHILKLHSEGLTSRKLIECIRENGFDRYAFTSRGQGCRYWIARTVELLRNKGYLQDDEVATVVEATDRVWARQGELTPPAVQTTADRGHFY